MFKGLLKNSVTRRQFLKKTGVASGTVLCGSLLNPFSASAKREIPKRTAIRIGSSHFIGAIAWWYARDLYTPDSIIWNWVDLGEFAAGRFVALQRGLIDVAVIPMTYLVRAVSQGYDVKAFVGTAGGCSRVVAHKDTDIYKLADLKGKRIGILKFSSQDIYLMLALDGLGLDWRKDVKRVDLANVSTLVGALYKKEVDAVAIWDPWGAKILAEGFGRDIPGIYKYWSKMHEIGVVRTDFLKAAPKPMQELTNAIVKGVVKTNIDPEDWAVQGHLISGVGEKASELSVKNAIPDVTIPIEDTKKLARKMYQLGVIKRDVEPIIEDYLYFDFLMKATHQDKNTVSKFGYCPKTVEEVG